MSEDPDGDALKFKIEILQNGNVVKVLDQTKDPTGWRMYRYGNKQWGRIAVQLSAGDYQWRAQAFDGSVWGPYTNPEHYFTVR